MLFRSPHVVSRECCSGTSDGGISGALASVSGPRGTSVLCRRRGRIAQWSGDYPSRLGMVAAISERCVASAMRVLPAKHGLCLPFLLSNGASRRNMRAMRPFALDGSRRGEYVRPTFRAGGKPLDRSHRLNVNRWLRRCLRTIKSQIRS